MQHKNKQPHADFLDIMRTPSESDANEQDYTLPIQQQYPDVPMPYCMKWHTYDTEAPNSTERIESLNKAAAAAERAAQTLRELVTRTEPMTPAARTVSHNRVAEAVHRCEDFLADFRLSYPLPNDHSIYETDNEYLNSISPRILCCEEDRVIIWLPRLPSITKQHNSLVFAQLRDILYNASLPRIPKWHCDFFHVFREGEDTLGIRDVDNYPYKPIIDVLARSMRVSDNPFTFSCGMYNHFTTAIRPGCYLCITKREKKVQFFQNFEKTVLPFMPDPKP